MVNGFVVISLYHFLKFLLFFIGSYHFSTYKKPRLKESTWQTKENIIQQKILPYFENYKINEITTKDVRAWQNEMLDILDHFDRLCNDISEGLPAEIEARQKQYEYYRDKLLTFKKKEAAENE